MKSREQRVREAGVRQGEGAFNPLCFKLVRKVPGDFSDPVTFLPASQDVQRPE